MSFSVGLLAHEILKSVTPQIWFQDQCTSTHEVAKDEAFEIKEDLKIYITDFQYAGRGRNQNTWVSPKAGDSLMITWSFGFGDGFQKDPPQNILSILLGLGIYQSLKTFFPDAPLSIKAPNDILLNRSKLSGILIENLVIASNSSQECHGRCLIGIGINIHSAPQNISDEHYKSSADIHLQKLNLMEAHQPSAASLNQAGEVSARLFKDLVLELHKQVLTAFDNAQSSALNKQDQKNLLQALNQNPFLNEQIIELSPYGDLKFSQAEVKWFDL